MGSPSLIKELRRFTSGEMAREVRERVDALPDFRPLPGSEYDMFGASRESLARIMPWPCMVGPA